MRILVVTNMYPFDAMPYYGVFVKREKDTLQKLGSDTDVYFINGKLSRGNYFRSVLGIARKVKSFRPDIIHIHHSYSVYPTYIALKLIQKKIPLVFTLHEGAALSPRVIGSRNIFNQLRHAKWIKLQACKLVDMVIAVNKNLLTSLNYTGPYREIPCGVDTEIFYPMDKESCRKKLNFPDNKKIVFFPGAIERAEKGYTLFSRSVALLDGRIKVILGGKINPEMMPYYYNGSDVVVQASHYEASPITIKEALACNVPLVSTPAGDTPTMVYGLPGCFICQPHPIEIALSINKAIDFGKRTQGREKIFDLKLDLNGVAKRVISVYEELLSKKS